MAESVNGKRKKCKLCGLTKNLRSFNPNKQMKDGRRNECKVCLNKRKLNNKKENFNKLSNEDKEKKREVWRSNYYERISYFKVRYEINKSDISKKFAQTKRGAKRRGIKFNIDKNDYMMLLSMNCFYCESGNKIGVDRFDNNIGYELENCVPCCAVCNRVKLDHDYDFLMSHLSRMLEVYRGRV